MGIEMQSKKKTAYASNVNGQIKVFSPEVIQRIVDYVRAAEAVHIFSPEVIQEGYKKILVLLDGTKQAESVLPHVEALVKHENTKLVDVVLIKVCEPPVISADYPEASMPFTWEEHVDYERARAKRVGERYLAEVEKRLNDTGLNVRSEVLLGDPAEEIVNYANGYDCNLITMATHQHFSFIRWLYGSATDKILRRVKCPILLVNA